MNKLLTIMAVVLVLLTGCAAKTPTDEDLIGLGFEMDAEEDSTRAIFSYEIMEPHLEITTGYNSGIDNYVFTADNGDDEIEYRATSDYGPLPKVCRLDHEQYTTYTSVEDSKEQCDESKQKEVMDGIRDTASDAGVEDRLDAAIAYFEFKTNQELPV